MAEYSRPHILLGIADEADSRPTGHPFVGGFVSLGSLLRRYRGSLENRQLVVALSVPRRDYVAALIGAGWVLSSPAPQLGQPIEVFRAAVPGTSLRAVSDKVVVAGSFSRLDEARSDPRVLTGGKTRLVDRYKAAIVLDGDYPDIETGLPEPGFLAELTGAEKTWFARMAAPPTDLALVGTAKWLREDLSTWVGDGDADDAVGTPLENYVLPDGERTATWATTVVPSAWLGEGYTIPPRCSLGVLDRHAAIKYLNDITAPIVVCIIDRSVADDAAAELIVQARASNSRPVSVTSDLGWPPPTGVEALAFTVAL